MTGLSNLLCKIKLEDLHTCYVMFSKDMAGKIIPQLTSSGFGFNVEMIARLARIKKTQPVKLFQVGISYYGRKKEEGKKITMKDGLQSIRDIFYYNLKP